MKFPGEHTETKTSDDDCDCDCGPSWRPSLTNTLLWHAQRAKMELIQEKIKRAIESRRGKVYDQIAEALADHLVAQAQRAGNEKSEYETLEDRIQTILGRKEQK